jgi:beta-mannosidase
MSEEEFNKCEEGQPAWEGHFGFHAGWYESWVRKVEVNHYFGGFTDTDDLIRKTQFIQAMSYRSVFEEARFQWPHCSMVVNWCWNEPFACAANNSVLSWPDVAKPCHQSIAKALRAQAAAFRTEKHLWKAGEAFTGEVWLLNDSPDILESGNVTVSYNFVDGWVEWGTLRYQDVPSRQNAKCGIFTAVLPPDCDGMIRIRLQVEGRSELDSDYTYICRCNKIVKKKMLNCDW